MKNVKKLIAVIVVVGVLGSAGAAIAATAKTPAEIAEGLTGKTVEELYKERAAGKTYGTIAKDAGKLDEFKAQMLEQKKAILDQRVKDGILTQQQADKMYKAMQESLANCDGTGNARMGRMNGTGFGQGAGKGRRAGMGSGACNGTGMGYGRSVLK